jgi:hypothetical protein
MLGSNGESGILSGCAGIVRSSVACRAGNQQGHTEERNDPDAYLAQPDHPAWLPHRGRGLAPTTHVGPVVPVVPVGSVGGGWPSALTVTANVAERPSGVG